MTSDRPLTTWVLTEGKVGMERQGIGLAEAVGLPYEVKRVRTHWMWDAWPERMRPDPRRTLTKDSSRIEAPWPGLLIACGRQSLPFSTRMHEWSRGETLVVQTQAPRTSLTPFDLVVPPRHDRLTGPNVMSIIGAPHPLTPERLAKARRQFAHLFGPMLAPRVAVLIGGNSKSHKLTRDRAEDIAHKLIQLAHDRVSLMVTLSRRTGPEADAIIRKSLLGTKAFVWDGRPPNPYEAMLGWADAVLVTADSVNMVTEAAVTGKPVHILALDGGSPKFDRFHAEMEALGIARPYAGRLDFWSYRPLLETPRVATVIRQMMGLERPDRPMPET